MNSTQQLLYDRYQSFRDDKLIELFQEGGFTPQAEQIFLYVLRERGINPAKLVDEKIQNQLDERGVNATDLEAVQRVIDDQREPKEEPEGPAGLGGWLILVGISLIANPFRTITNIERDFIPIFTEGVWQYLTDSSSPSYDPLLALFLVWEILFNVILLIASVVLIYLFFTKSKWFPKVYIALLLASFLFTITDSFAISLVYYGEIGFYEGFANLLEPMFWIFGVWIPYLLYSKRVKATFTRTKYKEISNTSIQESRLDRVSLFNEWSEKYDPTSLPNVFPFDGYDDVLDTVVMEAKVEPSMTVLDLGIGTGNLTQRLLMVECEVWGVDFSQGMLDKAAKVLPDVNLVQADLTKPFPPELHRRFDRIISSYLFHEFDDKLKFSLLQKLVEDHLTEGGMIVIGDIAFPNSRVQEKAHEIWHHAWDEGEHYWNAEEAISACAELGFSVSYEQVSSCGGVFVSS